MQLINKPRDSCQTPTICGLKAIPQDRVPIVVAKGTIFIILVNNISP